MRVLLCASGTTGDVHPLVAIAASMRQRGHDVHLLTNPAYAGLAAQAGVSFEAIGRRSDLNEIRRQPRAWTYSGGWKVWMKGAGLAPMRELYRTIERLDLPGETIVAASYLCLGARVAREKLHIPTATLHLNVHTIRSVHGVYACPPPEWLPDGLIPSVALPPNSPTWCRQAALWLGERLYVDPVMAPDVRQFREELGLPRLQGFVRDWWNSPDLAIGLYPDWWAGDHPDWPRQTVTTGFPFWDRAEFETVSPELQQFLDQAGQVVVFSPGASGSHSTAHFDAFARSCEATGHAGLILTHEVPETPVAPHRVRFEQYVPFRRLLPRVSAVVHHAGIGTSAQCLAAGVPQVVVPTLYNQPDTAIRLARLGVARRIQARHFSEQSLTRALLDVCDSPAVRSRCSELTHRMRDNDPLPQICDHLERLL